jgi:N-acetylglucosaminyl-diphospho-decaprenol L-rhamnosyltransferase
VSDVSAILVSHGDASWLPACLRSLRDRTGGLDVDVVVVENGDEPETTRAALAGIDGVRLLTCENRGFAHANNRGLEVARGRFVLFLNPDTEIVAGDLAAFVADLASRPTAGLAGGRQLTAAGELQWSIRRDPSVLRAWAEALGLDRLGAGERVRDRPRYECAGACDWTSGSLMLARREAIDAVGGFDEGYFLFSEEADLCRRLRDRGWEVVHLPTLEIVHHQRPGAASAVVVAHATRSRRRYARTHLRPWALPPFLLAVAVRLATRAVAPGRGEAAEARRRAARAGLRALLSG